MESVLQTLVFALEMDNVSTLIHVNVMLVFLVQHVQIKLIRMVHFTYAMVSILQPPEYVLEMENV